MTKTQIVPASSARVREQQDEWSGRISLAVSLWVIGGVLFLFLLFRNPSVQAWDDARNQVPGSLMGLVVLVPVDVGLMILIGLNLALHRRFTTIAMSFGLGFALIATLAMVPRF